jgi:hypothetical protein
MEKCMVLLHGRSSQKPRALGFPWSGVPFYISHFVSFTRFNSYQALNRFAMFSSHQRR